MRLDLGVQLALTVACTLGGIYFWQGVREAPGAEPSRSDSGSPVLDEDVAGPGEMHSGSEARGDVAGGLAGSFAGGSGQGAGGTSADDPFGTEGTDGQTLRWRRPRAARGSVGAIPPFAADWSDPHVPEQLARVALRFVGIDPAAEAIWARAINDADLSEDARSNLIEDLNEDGFPDPSNIVPADLPLVLKRLAIIERMAPSAMDEVNAAAFQEAYKDLVNMLVRLQGG